jgi:hypothetical protein
LRRRAAAVGAVSGCADTSALRKTAKPCTTMPARASVERTRRVTITQIDIVEFDGQRR